jgi:hypothetical protein
VTAPRQRGLRECNEMSAPDAFQDEMRRLLLGELGINPLALDGDTADRLLAGRPDPAEAPTGARTGRSRAGGRRRSSHPRGADRRGRRGSDRHIARSGQADGRLGPAGGASRTGPVCRRAAGPGQGPERRRGPGRRGQRRPQASARRAHEGRSVPAAPTGPDATGAARSGHSAARLAGRDGVDNGRDSRTSQESGRRSNQAPAASTSGGRKADRPAPRVAATSSDHPPGLRVGRLPVPRSGCGSHCIP